jgi:L-asparaginase II
MTELVDARPVFSFTRKGITEVVVHGIVALKHQSQPLLAEEASTVIVTRSLLKPWQALATGGLDSQQAFWSMGFASHSGQSAHLEQLNDLIKTTGAAESNLVCPRTWPLDANVASAMRAGGQSASRLHHPCAGKHLLMLAAAAREDASIESYWHEDHPVQKRIQALVGKEASEKLTWVTDSCGVPVAAMPVRALMNMYERLALDTSPSAIHLKKLWLEHPKLVGGLRRLDTDICEMSHGRMIAKEGADGLLMAQSLPVAGESIAGCFVKISSGHNLAHLGLALWSLLSVRDDLNAPLVALRDYLRSRLEEWVPKDQALQILYRRP